MGNISIDPYVEDQELAAARSDLEQRIRTHTLQSVDDLRDTYPTVWRQPDKVLELAYTEYVLRVANGESPDREDWYRRYPDWRDRFERLFGLNDLITGRDTHRDQPDATIPKFAPADATTGAPDQPVGYEVFEELGRGGMAVVYRARQVNLNRVVALKVLRGGAWFRPEDALRIRREAEAAARLQHPNIVQVYEIGDWDGVPYLALEYVAGGTLAEFLAQSQRQGTLGTTPTQAAELVETLSRAIQAAHDHGIVHRDLKPANVLLSAEFGARNAEPKSENDSVLGSTHHAPNSALVPKVADFGLAVSCDLSIAITQTATLVGTPCYMAPEQAEGRRADIGPRTDVYALGGLLYELLTGRPPFQGATVLETLELVRSAEAVPPRQLRPQVPHDLETICLKCLAKEPGRRYSSALALVEDLERFRTGRPILARPVSRFERSVKWVKRNRVVSALIVVVAGVLAAALGVLMDSNHRIAGSLAAEAQANSHLTAALEREQQSNASLRMLTARRSWEADDNETARRQLADVPPERRDAEWRYLNRVVNAQLAASDPHTQPLGFVTVSPDGTRIAALQDNSAGVWVFDGRTAKRHSRTALVKPDGPLLGNVKFTPDPAHLHVITFAKGTLDNGSPGIIQWTEVRTWNVVDPAPRLVRTARWPNPKLPPGLVLSSDGHTLIVGEEDTVSLWEFDSTGQVIPLGRHAAPVLELTLSRNGRFLASGDKNGTVKIWDLTTRSLVREQSGYKQVSVRGLFRQREVGDVSPDGRRYLFPGAAHLVATPIRILEAGDAPAARSILSHKRAVNCVRISPDGRTIASAGGDGTVSLWDAGTGQEWLKLRVDKVAVHGLDFSPDGNRLVTTGLDRTVRIWDVRPLD